MLDSTQGASANTIGDFFELPDLDPEVDEIVCKDGLRYHRHPRGRFDSDILLDFYTFGLPANEGIARAQALSAGAPQWLEPIGADNEDDLQRYAAQGYRSLGQWFVMGHRMTGSSPAPGVHCGGAGCRCGERSDAGFRSMAAWRLSGKRWSLRTTRMCARWCPFPTIDGRGFADAIFQELLSHAYDRGAREAILVSTPMAQAFYRSRGFEDVVPIRLFEWRPPERA